MANTNRYGLNRSIPAAVKHQVRQECGFGCVICGSCFIEYEHISPPFAEAVRHDPVGIALLCPQCHAKKTRGFLSADEVAAARRMPVCRINGASREKNLFAVRYQSIRIGGTWLSNCHIPIQCSGVPLLEFSRDPLTGTLLFSGFFFDSEGQPTLLIKENEWIPLASNWDVEVAGGELVIRSGPGKVSLKMHVDHGRGLVVDRLDAMVAGRKLIATSEEVKLFDVHGNLALGISGGIADRCHIGLSI